MRLLSLGFNIMVILLILMSSDNHSDKAICAFSVTLAVGNYYHGWFSAKKGI